MLNASCQREVDKKSLAILANRLKSFFRGNLRDVDFHRATGSCQRGTRRLAASKEVKNKNDVTNGNKEF
jgi:hypothetical protein